MSDRKFIEEVPFEVDARVAIQLGRESISSSIIAIIELVKNAYDADAENVLISWFNLRTSDAFMTIEDDGNGMSVSDVKNCWLRIGIDTKQKAVKSAEKRRVMTGEKGLGRLGIDRLCKKLILQTKTKDVDYINELEVSWSDYEDSGKTLSQIKHRLFENIVPTDSLYLKEKNKGTRLKLVGLKDQWSVEAIKEIKVELALLISPFGGINDFTINLNTEYSDEDLKGPVSSEQYLEAAEWSVQAKIDDRGFVSASMVSNLYSEEYQMEPVKWQDWIKDRINYPRCGPLDFKFFYIPIRTTDEFKKIDFERKHITEFLSYNRGIRIYRDHFRAKPYGNPDGSGDWLNLGFRRSVNPAASSRRGWPVAPQQVVGAIFISREKNEGLIDQTNREGIVEEAPFFDLSAFAMKIIQWFESNVVEYNQSHQTIEKDSEKVKAATSKAKNKINKIKNSLSQVKSAKSEEEKDHAIITILSEIDSVENDLNESEKHVDELDRKIEDEKNTMSNLASLGILTVCFGHEAKGNCNRAYLNAEDLNESFEHGKFMITPNLENEFRQQIKIIMESTDYINKFAGFALANVKRDKRKRSKISIPAIAYKVIETFADSLESKQGIKINTTEIKKDVPKINGFEIDWESIFVNLLTNSIWAFRNFVPPGNEKKINVSIKKENEFIHINFGDNGKGLEKGTEKMIFLPNFSTRRNEKGVVDGTGMGLAIVDTFVCDHAGGTIDVKSPGEIGGAEFILKIPIN